MTDREKAIVMAHTGICMLAGDKFQIFHKYVEDIMGRPIWTHEIGCLADEIREKSKADFMALCVDENGWIPVSQPPKKAGKYIVTMRCLNRDFVDIANYSKDLYKVDADAFADKKGVAGWYGLDLEYGFYEHDFVTAWQDAPEPYKAESEE